MGTGAALRALVRLGSAFALVAVGQSPAFAQSFGQWTWDAAAGIRGVAYRNSFGGPSVSSTDQRDIDLSVGVRGYVIHPLVGQFGLGVTRAFTDGSGTSSIDSRRWGMNADLSLLPQGTYPIRVYARRQRFAYSQFTGEDPLALLRLPENGTTIGGNLAVRRGFLRDVRFWVDRSTISYPGQDRSTLNEREAVDWNRSTKTAQQRLAIERRVQDYGLAGLRFRDYQGSYDLRRNQGPTWKWEATINGLQRRLSYRSQPSDFSFLRTSERAYRPVRERDTLDMSYDGGVSSAAGRLTQSHGVQARYHWAARRDLTVVPQAGYGLLLSERGRLGAPRVGIGSTWVRRAGAFDVAANGQVSLLILQRGGDGPKSSDTTVAFDLGGSVGHGDQSSLRAELEGSWIHNRLRVVGEVIAALPDLGSQLSSIGTEDLLKTRLTLTRPLGRIRAFSFTDASRRKQDGRFATLGASVRTFNQTLQLITPDASVTGALGSTRVHTLTAQEYDFVSASALLRPVRLFSLTGSYRRDRRRVDSSPDIDGERAEGAIRFWLGAFSLSADAFWSRERTPGSAMRENRGLSVSLSRGFFGLLPIVTAGPQGGDIR